MPGRRGHRVSGRNTRHSQAGRGGAALWDGRGTVVAEMPFCVVVFCCIHVSPIHKIHFTGAQWGQILSRRTSQPADLPSRGQVLAVQ